MMERGREAGDKRIKRLEKFKRRKSEKGPMYQGKKEKTIENYK